MTTFPIQRSQVKFILVKLSKAHHDVAQPDPIRNIPAKFEVPAASGCGHIAQRIYLGKRSQGGQTMMLRNLDPHRNISVKFEVLAVNSCCDIVRTDKQPFKMLMTIPSDRVG